MIHDDAKISSLTPCAPGWHAVFTNEEGEPEFEPVACWALLSSDDGQSVVAMTRGQGGGANLLPADEDPMFVGLAAPGEEPDDWAEPCRDHLESLGAELGDEEDGEGADEEDEEDEG